MGVSGYPLMTSVSRFIVPFEIKEDFEAAKNRADNSPLFKRRKENDAGSYSVYDYIISEFTAEKGSREERVKLGISFVFTESGLKEAPDLMMFISDEGKSALREINVKLVDGGIYLFKNNLGLFWYELKCDWDEADNLVLNRFLQKNRELSFVKHISHSQIDYQLWEKTENPAEIALFCIGEWIDSLINEKLDFSAVFISSLKNSYDNEFEKLKTSWPSYPASSKYKIRKRSPVSKEMEVPHIAQLMNYAVFDGRREIGCKDDTEDVRCCISQTVTNGYSTDFAFDKNIKSKIKKPFQNVYWNASTEGSSFLVWYYGEEDDSYLGRAVKKDGYFKNDYFTMYMKTLFQSFSLIIYNARLQSAVDTADIDSEKNIAKIEESVNEFLLKSYTTSVSHVYQQIEYYNYIQERLRIKEDIQSTTTGLKALHEILLGKVREREANQEHKVEVALGLVSFFAIVSAITDTISLYQQIVNGDYRNGPISGNVLFFIEILVILIISAVGVYAVIATFKVLFRKK